ncbi:DNA-binding response regulator [Paenibacillus sp. 79R4]|uniref:response regulator n=1 Tax=Paenibacillus sp. 79R4 TaxID=2212847 RepID=UPI0015BEB07B|nr:response regulator [Paenibacillus sp. 79R4]NWL89740.1 DNA-binding response regulator [Paenibacillus sp. 79R4]
MNILVVDDESIIREGIQRTLAHHFPEYSVHLAAKADEAAWLLRTESIDLVLTDVRMPGMTGLELMELSRSRHPHVKWVVISAYSEFAYAREAVRLGARDYLLKPIGKEALIDMVEQLSEEIEQSTLRSKETHLLRQNVRLLREGALTRLITGLDLGGIDLNALLEEPPYFYVVMVQIEQKRSGHLEHFIVENVLTELIDNIGYGVVASASLCHLVGLVTPDLPHQLPVLLDELRTQLKHCLKVPFRIIASEELDNFSLIPSQVELLKKAAIDQFNEPEHDNNHNNEAIELALKYIRAHYQEELTLEKVSSVVFLNPVYFSQLFKQKVGQGFKDYIIHLRMEEARRLLSQPGLKISEVAEKVGYQDMRHFSQVFRRKYNMTPSDYRQLGDSGKGEGHRLSWS